jgi:hypothetical protein
MFKPTSCPSCCAERSSPLSKKAANLRPVSSLGAFVKFPGTVMGKHGRRTRDQMGKPRQKPCKPIPKGSVAAAAIEIPYVSKKERKAAGGLEAALAIRAKKTTAVTAALKKRVAKKRAAKLLQEEESSEECEDSQGAGAAEDGGVDSDDHSC